MLMPSYGRVTRSSGAQSTGGIKLKKMSDQEKHLQILKEVKATLILFLIVAVWHVGFGFGLNGVDVMVLGMPLWFFVSTIGAFVISVVGVIILLKFVFVNFELGDELTEENGGDES